MILNSGAVVEREVEKRVFANARNFLFRRNDAVASLVTQVPPREADCSRIRAHEEFCFGLSNNDTMMVRFIKTVELVPVVARAMRRRNAFFLGKPSLF